MAQSQKRSFQVRSVSFIESQKLIKAVRHAVFVVEQDVDPSLEWDGSDIECRHVLAVSAEGLPIATGRISTGGKIGRMAVLKGWRGQNVGRAVLTKLIDVGIEQGLNRLELSSQLHAIAFYQKAGFREHGDVYLDANIPHRKMTLYLDSEKPSES